MKIAWYNQKCLVFELTSFGTNTFWQQNGLTLCPSHVIVPHVKIILFSRMFVHCLPQSVFQRIVYRILRSPHHLKCQPQPFEEWIYVDLAVIALVFPFSVRYLPNDVPQFDNLSQEDASNVTKRPVFMENTVKTQL